MLIPGVWTAAVKALVWQYLKSWSFDMLDHIMLGPDFICENMMFVLTIYQVLVWSSISFLHVRFACVNIHCDWLSIFQATHWQPIYRGVQGASSRYAGMFLNLDVQIVNLPCVKRV